MLLEAVKKIDFNSNLVFVHQKISPILRFWARVKVKGVTGLLNTTPEFNTQLGKKERNDGKLLKWLEK